MNTCSWFFAALNGKAFLARPGETSAGGGHGTGKKGGKAHGGAGGAGKGSKGSKGYGGMSRAQNTAGRNRAAQGRQGANGGGRRN